MLVDKNWLKTNINQRLVDKNCKIITEFQSHKFEPSCFMDAAIEVVDKIKHYDLYLGFSGGADSDFVCRILHQQGVKFTPMIVITSGNVLERQYAFHTCRQLNLNPMVFELSDKDLLEIYYDRILRKLGGYGLFMAQNIVCTDYVKEKGGKFLTGVNAIGGDDIIDNKARAFMGMYEFDFYSDPLYGDDFEIPFNLYTPKIVYETIKRMRDDMDEAETKYQLYEITDFRPKLKYKYDDGFKEKYLKLNEKYIKIEEQFIWKHVPKEIILKSLLNFDKKFVI